MPLKKNRAATLAHSCASAVYLCFLYMACLGLLEQQAYAYIDPGSGALLWQMFMAGLLGSMFYFRKFWKRILARGKKEEAQQIPPREGDDSL